MKTYIPIALLAIFLISATGCNKEKQQSVPEPVNIELTSKGEEVIQQSNDFGIKLFQAVSQVDDMNLMISPLSATTALTMLLNGCDTETYIQIRDMLGFADMDLAEINLAYQSLISQLLLADPKVKLDLANAVFYRKQFQVKAPYLDTMDFRFDAHIQGLDFAQPEALETINGWASDNTNGKIKKVLDEISPQAVMFLMNALYFKGDWTYQFDKDLTTNGPFYKEDGSSVNVPFMRSKVPLRMIEESGYTVAELPYGRQNFSMVLILPNVQLSEFMAGFNPEVWEGITSSLDGISEPMEMDIILPKFKFEYEKKLNDQLQALGMVDAFIPSQADLSRISDAGIFVSFVKQNTYIDVNEEGTEAAAVTTIGIEYTAILEFALDRPFVFAIRERTTNALLFVGKLVEPEGGDV